MIDHILLAIACVLLGVIAFRISVSSRAVAMYMAMMKAPETDSKKPTTDETDSSQPSDVPQSDHLAEVDRQERFIDEWVDNNCTRTHDLEVLMHQRWEGLKHYNRSKKR